MRESMSVRWTTLFAFVVLLVTCFASGQDRQARQRYCPACDSSVFSYCSEKLLHDACCCHSRHDPSPLPYQCYYADCSFLHAKSCEEHRTITRCCCDRLFFQRNK